MTLGEDMRIDNKLAEICKWNTYLLKESEVKEIIKFLKDEIDKTKHERVASVVEKEKGFRELSEWVVKNRRSVFNDADIPHESKRSIAFGLGYSDDTINKS